MGDGPAPPPEPLVGREEELAELLAAVQTARAGSGALRLVGGEPGIGKTRLAREVAAHAEHAGFAVGWGRTWEAGGAPPFWPWTRVLRDLLRRYDEDDIARAVRRAPAVTALLPELTDGSGTTAFAAGADAAGSQERFAVFEAVSTLLGELGRRRPALLVLEDVHAADEPSLLLLQFVAADLRLAPVLVLATFRDVEARQDERRAARVGELARQGPVLHLGGLTREQTGALIDARLPAGTDASFAARVQDATSGNPFFVEELVRLQRAGAAGIPLGVREAVRSRLDLLPPATREVLVTAAVFGRSFDEPVLAGILERPVEQVVDILRPAGDAALVVRDGPELRFRHGLIREVLVDETPAADRARLHARMVDVLESLPRPARERHLSELAHHAVRAVSGNAEQAIVHARNAGEAAMRALAFEEAVRQFDSALQVVTLTQADGRVALDLLVSLARARAAAGDVHGAREAARQAGDLARETSSPQHLAQAALAYPSMALAVWRVDEEHLCLLRDAVEVLDEIDPATGVLLLCGLIAESYFARTPVGRSVERAVQLAQTSGDPRALAHAHFTRHYVERNSNVTVQTLEQDESTELARRAGDTDLEGRARIWKIGRWLEHGHMADADAEILAYEQLAQRTRRPVDLWWTGVMRGMRLVYEGEYGEAARVVQETVDYGYRFAGDQALSIFGAQDWLVRRDRVPMEELLATLSGLPQDFRQRLPVRSVFVLCHALTGQPDRASGELAELAADDYALLPRDRSRLTCLALLAEAAAALGDRERAAELLVQLEPYEHLLAVAPPFAVFGPFTLHRGRLLHVLGRHDEAAASFDEALRTCVRTHARPDAARTRLHFGNLLTDAGDLDRARELLTQARDEAHELGMTLLEQEATERLGSVAAAAAPAPVSAVRIGLEGEYWTIRYGGTAVRLRDSKGLHYLSRLIRSPGREIHVLELTTGAAPVPRAHGAEGLHAGSDDLGPVLDERAKAEYRRRIEELRREVQEATDAGDTEAAARAREEHDVFVRELARALGLHGRDRRAGSAAEQARINVSKAVRTAIRRLHEQDAELGAELDASVRTGLFCAYLPLADHRRWEVAART